MWIPIRTWTVSFGEWGTLKELEAWSKSKAIVAISDTCLLISLLSGNPLATLTMTKSIEFQSYMTILLARDNNRVINHRCFTYHVSITAGFYFVNVITLDSFVKHLINWVQEGADFEWWTCGCDFCESNDVREVNSHGLEVLSGHLRKR